MIQRFIYTALQTGLKAIADTPSILDDLFGEHYGLSATELAAIKTFFKVTPPSVIHGYPNVSSKFPLFAITLSAEQETDHILGDDAGMELDTLDPDFGADISASLWSHSYQVTIYAEHPDVALYCYEVAKASFMAAHDYFISVGLLETSLAGMDLIPDPRYIPENLFVRQLSFSCKREFQYVNKKKIGRAFKLAGLHIDSSGSPNDVGDVQTLITVRES